MKRAMITLAVLLAAATGFGQSHPATQGDFVIPDGGTTSQAIHVYGYGIGGVWIGPCASATPTTLTVTMAPNAMTEPAAGLFATLDTYAIPAGVASGSVYVAFDLEVTPCLQWTKLVVDTGPTGETWPIDINYTPRMVGPLAFSGGDFTLGLTDSLRWGGDLELYRDTALGVPMLCIDNGDTTDCNSYLRATGIFGPDSAGLQIASLSGQTLTMAGGGVLAGSGVGGIFTLQPGQSGPSGGAGAYGLVAGGYSPTDVGGDLRLHGGSSGADDGGLVEGKGGGAVGAGKVSGSVFVDAGAPSGGATGGHVYLGINRFMTTNAVDVLVGPMISLGYVLQLEEVVGDPTAKPAEGMCYIWKTDGTAGIGAAGDILTACTESAVTRRAVLYAFAGGVVW